MTPFGHALDGVLSITLISQNLIESLAYEVIEKK